MVHESCSATEAARKLGVSTPTLKRMAAGGDVEAFRTPGGHLRVRLASLETLRSDNRARPTPQPSQVLMNRRERVEELSLEAQELRAKREIEKLKAEEEAEARRRRDELQALERAAERQAQAERAEQVRSRQQAAEEREQREAERQLAEFRSRWLATAEQSLSRPGFDWLSAAQRREVMEALELEIGRQRPHDEARMLGAIRQAVAACIAPWEAQRRGEERRDQVTRAMLWHLPVGASDAEKAQAVTSIRNALAGLRVEAAEFELRAAAQEALRLICRAIKRRNLIERLLTWAVRELPWGATDREKRVLRRQCAGILAELSDDVCEDDARDPLEAVVRQATREIEERQVREQREQRKAELIKQGVSEVSTYLSQLRRERLISSDECFDSEFTSDLRKAVKEGLEDELSGDEDATEVKEFVQEIIDDELD